MLVKLVHFYILEPQRPIGGLIFWGGVEHDIEHCHFVGYFFFYQTCNLTLVKNTKKLQ
jgi:hypothetical protein